MNSNFANNIANSKVQQAYDAGVATRVSKVEKKASDAIKSFADLVDEINKLQNETVGTSAKTEVNTVAADVNNSSVMVTKMLAAQMQALHNITTAEAGPEQSA